MERIIKLLAKSIKSGYSSMFLLGQFLAYVFNTDDEVEFLKKAISNAEKIGYNAVKNYSLDSDIEKMYPKSMKIEDFEQEKFKMNQISFNLPGGSGGLVFKWINKREIMSKYTRKRE